MYFSYYGGILNWLEPQQYFAEPWKYMRTVEGEDGEMYDVVMHQETGEFRYTNI